MAKTNGNGGRRDTLSDMYADIVDAKQHITALNKSFSRLGRGLLKLRSEQRAEFASIKRRLDALESRVA